MACGLGQLSVGIVFILVTDKYWNEQSKHLETLEKFGRKISYESSKAIIKKKSKQFLI